MRNFLVGAVAGAAVLCTVPVPAKARSNPSCELLGLLAACEYGNDKSPWCRGVHAAFTEAFPPAHGTIDYHARYEGLKTGCRSTALCADRQYDDKVSLAHSCVGHGGVKEWYLDNP